jgi:hypothetical protein
MDGANGSWTWQRSNGAVSRSSSTVRVTSMGSAARRRVAAGAGSASPTASTRTSPGAPRTSPERISCRERRTRPSEKVGARIVTRCPRAASCSLVAWMPRLTSCPDSQAYGVTCAMTNGSAAATRAIVPGRPRGLARVGGLALGGLGASPTIAGAAGAADCATTAGRLRGAFFAPPPPFGFVPGRSRYRAMNFSVSSRAWSSGRCVYGDFIRYDDGPSIWPPSRG